MSESDPNLNRNNSAIIQNPKGVFRPGRVFEAIPAQLGSTGKLQTFVVKKNEGNSSSCYGLQNHPQHIAFSAGFQKSACPLLTTESNRFNLIIENDSIDPQNGYLIDFSETSVVDHSVKVRNIGRIDRNQLNMFIKASEKGAEAGTDSLKGCLQNYRVAGRNDASSTSCFGNRGSDQPTNYGDSLLRHGHISNVTQIEGAGMTLSRMELSSEYTVHPAKDFKPLHVLKTLWVEPAGLTSNAPSLKPIRQFNENCFAKIRRFVVLERYRGHCLCLPILTYNNQATSKAGVVPDEHAIIYTQDDLVRKEVSGERELMKKAIRMHHFEPREELRKTSRLNYAKIYTVEYNTKVCFVGRIHDESIKDFERDFSLTHSWLAIRRLK